MQYEPKCLICSLRTDLGPSCVRRSGLNRDASIDAWRLAGEQTHWLARLSACLLGNPILSLLAENRHVWCPVDSTGTGRLSSPSLFETHTYPALASRRLIGSTVLAQRADTRSNCEGLCATDVYQVDDGAAFSRVTTLLHSGGH